MSTLKVNTMQDTSGNAHPLGITHAVTYRLNATEEISGSIIDPVTSWEIADNSFDGKIGTWSAPSSGIFSFPATGIYALSVDIMMLHLNDSNAWCGISIKMTTDNGSNYSDVCEIQNQIVEASGSGWQYTTGHTQAILDVTDTSTDKFKMRFFSDGNESVRLQGETNRNATSIKLIRLGDT